MQFCIDGTSNSAISRTQLQNAMMTLHIVVRQALLRNFSRRMIYGKPVLIDNVIPQQRRRQNKFVMRGALGSDGIFSAKPLSEVTLLSSSRMLAKSWLKSFMPSRHVLSTCTQAFEDYPARDAS
eukprot:TRINITY_DN76043_c0_g1_i1.p1 TRINITY_DN76043_c0_g1~~TRINITY_DN76043_c0_g1_i1.p1  ORF type:complete len:124 (+),score=15.87 TRINITY_DN76043_c0_g1_i1:219-590(+)